MLTLIWVLLQEFIINHNQLCVFIIYCFKYIIDFFPGNMKNIPIKYLHNVDYLLKSAHVYFIWREIYMFYANKPNIYF